MFLSGQAMSPATQTGKVFIPVVTPAGLPVNTHLYSAAVGLPENFPQGGTELARKGWVFTGDTLGPTPKSPLFSITSQKQSKEFAKS